MTYKQPFVTQLVEFERVSPSGAVRKYKVLPAAGNRMAIVLHLDPTPVENKWTNDLWQVTQFNTEDEFKARCGQEMFDLVAELYDREIRPEVYKRLFSALQQIPKALGDAVASEEDNVHPFYILKAKLAFMQLVTGAHQVKDGFYTNVTDAQLLDVKERLEKEFHAYITVNTEYVRRIVNGIKPVYTEWGDHDMLHFEFELRMDGWDSARKVNKTVKSEAVRMLLSQLEQFLGFSEGALQDENGGNIISLTSSYSMSQAALESFKLFEQG